METDLKFGLVVTGGRMLWGINHGRMVRPRWLAKAVCHAWNVAACRVIGHSWYISSVIADEIETPPVCVWCRKKLGTQVA